MDLEKHQSGVVNVTADQVRAYVKTHKEQDFVLIDVRENGEYVAEHVPGAKLVPLSELEGRMAELRELGDKSKIVYCRSGGRSSRAAALMASRQLSNVFNLSGGLMGYTGHTVPDFPKLRTFDGKATTEEVLRQALQLEKGADRLYASLLSHFKGSPVAPFLEQLSQAEEAHGRAVYGALKQVAQGRLDDFEKLYASLEGSILESGHDVGQVVALAQAMIAEHGTPALLELALDLEHRAYDLYRALADRSDGALADTFLDLAKQEKRHALALLKAIDTNAAQAA